MNILQWLQSKIVIITVTLILISSITSFYLYQIDELKEKELENHCEKITHILRDIRRSETDEMAQSITFDENGEGIFVSPRVGDEYYDIEITEEYIRLKQDEREAIERLEGNIHLWHPNNLNTTGFLGQEEREWRDSRRSSIEFSSNESDLKMIMLRLNDGESYNNHIFITEED